jgi:hypothetical protein
MRPGTLYSIVRNPIESVYQIFTLFLDANIRVSKAELDRVGRSSIKLADGSDDYFGTLGAFSLMCLY